MRRFLMALDRMTDPIYRPIRKILPDFGGIDFSPVVVLLAMLAAKGTSVLRNIYVIHRGYEDLAERLNALGAHIETFRDI